MNRMSVFEVAGLGPAGRVWCVPGSMESEFVDSGVEHREMLTNLISQIHLESRGTYGARRVHAELTLGRGVEVGHNQVELLMRRAELKGVSGRRKIKRIRADDISTDLVKRDFARQGPNQLWVTDTTEHPTREGKVYCCVILDVYSRRVVGCVNGGRKLTPT